MNTLVDRILERQPDAMWMARQMGPASNHQVLPLTKNNDSAVRALAIRCLNQSGGDNIEQAFINGLTDGSPMVRAAAVFGLQNHLKEEIYLDLIEVYSYVPEGIHRRDVALLIGNLNTARLDDVQALTENEADPDAMEGLLVVAAKLGNRDAQVSFGSKLREATNDDLLRFLNYSAYIGQPWTLYYLGSILDQKENLVWVGSDRFPEAEPQYLRACDVAVELIAMIANARFSFLTEAPANYTDSQLDEVRDFVDRLG